MLPTPNPFIFATAALQWIRRADIVLFGPILPLHNPIHAAEEVTMLDALSGSRLPLLFLRGVPNELRAFSFPLLMHSVTHVLAPETISERGKLNDWRGQGRSMSSQDLLASRLIAPVLEWSPSKRVLRTNVRTDLLHGREEALWVGWHMLIGVNGTPTVHCSATVGTLCGLRRKGKGMSAA